MTWKVPIPQKLVPTKFQREWMDEGETHLPLWPHPGAFATQRKYEVHTGVDLYAPEGTPIFAVEDGYVVEIEWFTGPDADPPCPWWEPTKAVLVEGASGVVLYGEVSPLTEVGDHVDAGQIIAMVKRVLKNDKGLPTSMLHLELHAAGTKKSTHPWTEEAGRPATLRDPTLHLLQAIGRGP